MDYFCELYVKTARFFDSSGRRVFEHSQHLTGENVYHLSGVVHSPRLWQPDSPALYVVDLRLRGRPYTFCTGAFTTVNLFAALAHLFSAALG